MATLRGAVGDHHKHHISNGLYLLPVLDAISMPYQIIDKPEDIGHDLALLSPHAHLCAADRCAVHARSAARGLS